MAAKNFGAIVFLCFTTLHVISAISQVCKVNVKNGIDKQHPPMVVSTDDESPNYVYPTVDDPANLVVPIGEVVTLFCPPKTNSQSTKVTDEGVLLVNGKPIASPAKFQCIGGTKFSVEDTKVDFKNITCQEKPRMSYNAILRETEENCLMGDRYEIGYELGDYGFLRTIELCHNKEEAKTLWAHAVIEPADEEKYRQTGPGSKSFKTGSLYEDMQMSSKEPYNLNVAYQTVDKILGNNGLVDKYMAVKTSDRKYLARGHLVANADKMYKSEQDSTYFFANVVPMWQQINANPGNWFFVEEYVRYLSTNKKSELDIYVGGVGTLELEDKPIYLYHNENEDKIPVPKVIYKCVVNKKTVEGLCFLVVNNPYVSKEDVEDEKNNYVVCKKNKSCEKINDNYDNPELGYMYCCSLKEFYKNNREELGLEEIESYINAKEMDLLTKTKGQKPTEIK